MSEAPSDIELLAIYRKGAEQGPLHLYNVTALRAVFLAGRASVTPPTREAIAEAIWRANAHDVGDDYLAGDSADWLPEADAVLALFTVPPTESEGKPTRLVGLVGAEQKNG
jgi:hypothetical protein